MAKDTLVWIIILEAVILGVLRILLHQRTLFKERTWDEVPELLRRLDGADVSKLFDMDAELDARMLRHSHRARRALRVRLDMAREYLRRMQHNALIIFQWADTEWSDMVRHGLSYDEETREKILTLRRETVVFRIAVMVVLGEIWLWSLLHFDKYLLLPIPRVGSLRRAGGIDILETYRKMKEAAAALALIYGEESFVEINNLM